MNLLLTNGDITFTDGQLQLVSALAAEVSQKLQVRYRFFLGEWVLDERIGVPYFQEIFGKGRDLNIVQSYLMKVALTCPGVASLAEFDMVVTAATRTLAVDLTAILTSGETLDFSEEFVL